jgi:hypothetical protein
MSPSENQKQILHFEHDSDRFLKTIADFIFIFHLPRKMFNFSFKNSSHHEYLFAYNTIVKTMNKFSLNEHEEHDVVENEQKKIHNSTSNILSGNVST